MRVPGTFAACAILMGLSGCAAGSAGSGLHNDPYESTNRSIFASHQVLYKNVIRPMTVAYNDAMPEPARDGIHNFLVNLGLPATFANDLLQGEIVRSGQTLGRFAVNSTVGVGGIVDVAGRIGIPEHETGFGDTLAGYGVGEGPYLYLPLVGPTVPRDLAGKIVDAAFDPLVYVTYGGSLLVSAGRDSATFLDKRSRTVATTDEIDKVSDDPYATTRLLYQKHLEAEADHTAPDTDFDEHPEDVRLAVQAPAGAAQGTVVAAGAPAPDLHAYCESLAQTRGEDAVANGDGDLQQTIRDRTYTDCVSSKYTQVVVERRVTEISAME